MAINSIDIANEGQLTYYNLVREAVNPTAIPTEGHGQLTIEHLNALWNQAMLQESRYEANIINIEPPLPDNIDGMENMNSVGFLVGLIGNRPFTLADLEHCYQQAIYGNSEPRLMILPQLARENFHTLLPNVYQPERTGILERRFNNCTVHFRSDVDLGQVWFIHIDNDGMPITLRPYSMSLSRKFEILSHTRLAPITDNDINIITGGDITWPVR